MNTFKEFLLSFLEASRERLKNPIIGAFFLAWVAINWRIIFILLWSDQKVEDRIKYIEKNYFDENINFWIPLIAVGFYALILPYLMVMVEGLSQKAISLRKLFSKNQKLADIRSKQTIAAEEWQLQIIKEGSPDISKLKVQIENLHKDLQERDEYIGQITSQQTIPFIGEKEPEVSPSSESATEVPKKQTTQRKTKKKTSSKTEESGSETKFVPSSDYPVMRDVVVRDLAKTESEWILLYGFYSSQYGTMEFTREDLAGMYETSKRKTNSRFKNLNNNLKTLIRQGLFKYINDTQMLMSNLGKNKAQDILNR